MFVVLLSSPTLPGEMSRFITVETNNFLSLSSVGAAPSLGLSTGFLCAVSLQMSWFVTTVAIPQVVYCAFTFLSKCYWVTDHVNLHSNLSCLVQVAFFSRLAPVLQSCHVWARIVWV